ncbi:MAG: prepilin-type N-terminal cleavage/methylation protein [Bacillus sp. (in: firmicutes)]|jgi:hypothetical protein|nr:prepilin-type N-terminal cleavage/methylation protein [Bacillus sp. (in: firmicutes)]
MLRRSEGYFLAELLLSLTAWFLITGFLLPIVILLKEQAVQVHLENTAVHLLYDEMERQINEGFLVGNKTEILNGIIYEISWRDDTSQTEVCVEYKDVNSIPHKKCKSPE